MIRGRDLSADPVCGGTLRLHQPRRGYRFSLDAVLLARFAAAASRGRPVRAIADLGAGTGVVGLLLARELPRARVTLVEIQPRLAALAWRNAAANGLAGRVVVHCDDLRRGGPWCAGEADLVVANPPFYRVGAGRLSPKPGVAVARHEVACDIAALLRTARGAIAPAGAFALVHLASRRGEVCEQLAAAGFTAARIRCVLPDAGRPAVRILCLATREPPAGPLRVEEEAPLVVGDGRGGHAAEVARMLRERPGPAAALKAPETPGSGGRAPPP